MAMDTFLLRDFQQPSGPMDALMPDHVAAGESAAIPAAHAASPVPGAKARTVLDGDVQTASLVSPGTALISDALFEPLLAEARERRVSYLGGSFPTVSVLLLLLILCVGWLS